MDDMIKCCSKTFFGTDAAETSEPVDEGQRRADIPTPDDLARILGHTIVERDRYGAAGLSDDHVSNGEGRAQGAAAIPPEQNTSVHIGIADISPARISGVYEGAFEPR